MNRFILFASLCLTLLLACEKNDDDYFFTDVWDDIYFSPTPSSDESRYVKVFTNQETWVVVSSEDWCVVEKYSDGFTIMADHNRYLDCERHARVEIISGDFEPIVIKVVQYPVVLTVMSDCEYYIAEDGGTFDIQLSCNAAWSIVSDKDWVSASPQSGFNDCDVAVTVTANMELCSDVAELQIRAGERVKKIVVNRAAAKRKYMIGDLWPDDVNPVGIVFSVANEGKSGKIFSIDKEFVHQWSSESYNTGAHDHVDGATNMCLILERLNQKIRHVYPAFMLCYELGEEWYLPATQELIAIYECWNGGSGESNIIEREKCDERIRRYGGIPLNSSDWSYYNYMSSCEYDSTSYIFVDFDTGDWEYEIWNPNKQIYERRKHVASKQGLGVIRPVRAY